MHADLGSPTLHPCSFLENSPSSSFPFSLHSLPCDDVSEKTLDAESIEPSRDMGGHMTSSAVVMVQSCICIEDIMVRWGRRGDGRPGRTKARLATSCVCVGV